MNFIFECWKYLWRVSKANEWEILSAQEDKIRIPEWPWNFLFLLYKHHTRWVFVRKLDIFTCENNMLSSRVKISPLLWLHNRSHLSHQKTIKVKWFGSSLHGVYIINRTLHGRLGIQILSSHAESISHSFALLTHERYFQHLKIKFASPRGHVISSI